MALLTSVFQKLLAMALTALPVTAVVLLARFFLRKAPKKFSCVLWLAVAFRLVCPVAPEGALGIVRGPETARWVKDTLAKPATGLESEAFHDILGYDGYRVTASWSHSTYWSVRTYYAADPATWDLMPIAESFGFDGPEDYAVDLDGDGMKELVCNVMYGGDGAVRVCIYQRRADGIYLGWLDSDGLPGHMDWGINSTWEEYDPAENVFRIHYAVEGQEDYAVLETHGLERVVFTRYVP